MRALPLVALALLASVVPGAQGSGESSTPEIVFSSSRPDGDLVVMNQDGTRRRVLTPNVRDDRAPSWSQDGRRIAFSHLDGSRSLIEVLDLRTGRLLQLGEGWNPDWSADGKRLAFVSSKPVDLATMKADGTDRRLLNAASFGIRVTTKPTWAPDGKRIAFIGRGLYTIRPDGSDGLRLRPEGRYGRAAWSPNGRRIAFDCGTARFALCLVRKDGSGFRGLTKRGHTPSWSPRGDLIAIASYNRTAAVLIRPSGKLVRIIAPGSVDDEPDWSPDGHRLVVSEDVGPGIRLYATDPSGSRLARLTHSHLSDDATSAWSPDGRWVAFRRQLVNSCSLGLLDVQTGRLRRLLRTRTGQFCFDRPDWSRDSRRILYARRGDLWVIPRRGGSPTRITRTRAEESSPRWAPDGRSIGFVSRGRIWLLQGGRRRLLVARGGRFAWSHDGQMLAYEGYETSTSPTSIYLRAGSGPPRLLFRDGSGPPSWSPQDDRIAFLQSDPDLSGWSLAVGDLAGHVQKIFGGDPMSPDWRP